MLSIANWNGIATIYVDPKSTLKIYLKCKKCEFKDNRDLR